MAELLTAESLISFLVLVILEIVLGIDNVIFVSIIINKLDKKDHKRARRLWMVLGILARSGMLLGLSWLLSQKGNYIIPESWFGKGFDLASLIMLIGGLFLIYKSVKEIHAKLEGEDLHSSVAPEKLTLTQAILQITLIDSVFSFDSVITAGGTAKHLEIMIVAVIIAMFVMFYFSESIASFVAKHPTIKMLALSFLVMIGLGLIIEGWNAEQAHHLNLKNYIYFGMAFSFAVEMLNMRFRAKQKVVELHGPKLDKKDEV
ncbi:MAG: hypothetical protein RLZZ337_1981 [Bacteroidota bacterium]|jgi:predicted tellurium resistance membrane protein TerC